MKNKFFSRHLFLVSLIFLVLLFGSNFFVYHTITSDYSKKLASLGLALEKTNSSLTGLITLEKEKLSDLEEEANTKIFALKQSLEKETSTLKFDLQNVEDITKDIDSKVGDLEDTVSEISVESSDFSAIVDDVIKAVVSVHTNKGQGSGVFFDSSGYLFTNEHVISGASGISVLDYQGRAYSVQLVGVVEGVDLAVLKVVNGENFYFLDLADASSVRVGERVIAIGNPLGLSFSVTEGIVSALARQFSGTSVKFIQTDVPINPGNSGGPLVNVRKEIIGINTFKTSDTEGIGFALPSSVLMDVKEQVLA